MYLFTDDNHYDIDTIVDNAPDLDLELDMYNRPADDQQLNSREFKAFTRDIAIADKL